jgi:hypothetical protein
VKISAKIFEFTGQISQLIPIRHTIYLIITKTNSNLPRKKGKGKPLYHGFPLDMRLAFIKRSFADRWLAGSPIAVFLGLVLRHKAHPDFSKSALPDISRPRFFCRNGGCLHICCISDFLP